MIIESSLPGVFIFEPRIFQDSRGYFFESYNKRLFAESGITDEFVQDNLSFSHKGTLRGLHYQLPPYAQAKLMSALKGAIYDVAVDIRKDSPNFGKWFGIELSADNRKMLYIPQGFAHGFCALSETVEITYKCSDFYIPTHERAINCFDKDIGIDWPVQSDSALMSDKDRRGLLLSQAEL